MSLRPLLAAALTSLALTAVALAGCGKLGQLEKPSALNGSGHATTRQTQDPPRMQTIDPRDRSGDPTATTPPPPAEDSTPPTTPSPQ
jgi:predicted small lipoprotein YifL